MIIDFHTHIFPDNIAASTISYLSSKAYIPPYATGTLEGLKTSMKEALVDLSVVLPVVTKPKQFDSILSFATLVNETDGLISFGGIHPQSEHYQEELDQIHAKGLKGVKLHPDYQGTFIDDESYINLITYALDLGLIIDIHAGFDGGFQAPYRCTPTHSRRMLDEVLKRTRHPDPKIVLAHTGGLFYWDQVEELLVDQKVYFDLSYSLGKIPDEQLYRLIRNHGIDRILFATDCPWSSQKHDVDYLKGMDLTDGQKERIFSKNAMELLNL